MREQTRRDFLAMLGASTARQIDAQPGRSAVDDLLAKSGPWTAVRRLERSYRVDATVLLLGMPVFSRNDAGAALASVEEFESARGRKATRFRFGAGSWPERVRGINRYGWLEEAVVYPLAGEPAQAAWFGAMTSMADDSFSVEHGKQQNDSRITSTQGRSLAGQSSGERRRMRLPARLCWRERDEIRSSLRASWSSDEPRGEALAGSDPSVPAQLFLSGIWHEMQASRGETMFWHNAEPFKLRTQRRGDSLSGSIESVKDNCNNTFRLQTPVAGALPSRIEYRAKPFLRLTLVG